MKFKIFSKIFLLSQRFPFVLRILNFNQFTREDIIAYMTVITACKTRQTSETETS